MSDYSSRNPFTIPGPGLSELVGTAAVPWRTALAGVAMGVGVANLTFRGNSDTEGYLGTTFVNAFARRTDAALCTALGQAQYGGYYPVSPNVGYGAAMAYGVAGPALNNLNDSGFAGEAAYLSTTTVITSPTINPATGFWIHCQKGPNIGGSFTYTVNGGAVQGPVGAGAAPRKGGRIWDHGNAGGLASGGANTVVITSNVTFGSVVEGIMWFNGNHNTTRPQGFITQANAQTGVGLRTWVCGHFGYATSQFVVPGFSNPVTATPASTALTTDPNEFIVPHCNVTFLGINDITQGVSAAQYLQNIQAMVANDRAAAVAYGYSPPFEVFMSPYGTVNDTGSYYRQYGNVLKNYCNSQGFGYIDLGALFGNLVGNATLSSDNIHLSNTGHAMLSNYLAQYLRDV